jgi:hypothetical protein
VQFQNRIKYWVKSFQARIGGAVRVPVTKVRCFPWSNICLYLIDFTSADQSVVQDDAEVKPEIETRAKSDRCPYCGQSWKNAAFPVGWDEHAKFKCTSVAHLPQPSRKPEFKRMMHKDGYVRR